MSFRLAPHEIRHLLLLQRRLTKDLGMHVSLKAVVAKAFKHYAKHNGIETRGPCRHFKEYLGKNKKHIRCTSPRATTPNSPAMRCLNCDSNEFIPL